MGVNGSFYPQLAVGTHSSTASGESGILSSCDPVRRECFQSHMKVTMAKMIAMATRRRPTSTPSWCFGMLNGDRGGDESSLCSRKRDDGLEWNLGRLRRRGKGNESGCRGVIGPVCHVAMTEDLTKLKQMGQSYGRERVWYSNNKRRDRD